MTDCDGGSTTAIPRRNERGGGRRARACFSRDCRWPIKWTGAWRSIWNLFSRGGLKVLEKIERQDYDVLRARPVDLENGTREPAAGRHHAAGFFQRRMTVGAVVRLVHARRSRSSQEFLLFFSAASGGPQRRAMCAIYAFMRYCDDLSDDEGIADRAAAIAQLARRSGIRRSAGNAPDHPLWPAFVDTVDALSKFRTSISST